MSRTLAIAVPFVCVWLTSGRVHAQGGEPAPEPRVEAEAADEGDAAEGSDELEETLTGEQAPEPHVLEEPDESSDEPIIEESPLAPRDATQRPPEHVEQAESDEETRGAEDALDPLGLWGGPRLFISGRLDLGFLFLRPSFHFGYGTPHETWFGIEINPLVSGRGVGGYAGLRAEIPFVELRAGARYFFTFTRSFLAAMDEFDHITIRDRTGPASNYFSFEAQVELNIPIGPLNLSSETTGTFVTLVDDGFFVYEEELRVVIEPSFIWSTSLAVEFPFGDHDEFYVAPGAEIVHLVERSDFVLRVGLRAGIRMWDDLEVRVIAFPAIVSPDRLGASGGDTFLMGIRYRWATDKPGYDDDD